jgi:hypothetical protein
MEFQVHKARPDAGTRVAVVGRYNEIWQALLNANGGSVSIESDINSHLIHGNSPERKMWNALRQRGDKHGHRLRTSWLEGRRYFWLEKKEQ